MAGIYIHIPFCKSRCIYCGFFSTTSLAKRQKYVDAVLRELENRKGYLCGEPIETVYLGGGTPSQLPDEELERILFAVHNIYNVREGAEISIEANPDDVSAERLENWRCMSINRLSMGVQTFHNERLRFLNRRQYQHRPDVRLPGPNIGRMGERPAGCLVSKSETSVSLLANV